MADATDFEILWNTRVSEIREMTVIDLDLHDHESPGDPAPGVMIHGGGMGLVILPTYTDDKRGLVVEFCAYGDEQLVKAWLTHLHRDHPLQPE